VLLACFSRQANHKVCAFRDFLRSTLLGKSVIIQSDQGPQ
jgi:hypothetical protein